MIDRDLMLYLAELGKIGFAEEELDGVTGDMKNIISLMDNVREFDGGTEPYTLAPAGYGDLREDECKSSYIADKVTANVKKVTQDSFVVPKVV